MHYPMSIPCRVRDALVQVGMAGIRTREVSAVLGITIARANSALKQLKNAGEIIAVRVDARNNVCRWYLRECAPIDEEAADEFVKGLTLEEKHAQAEAIVQAALSGKVQRWPFDGGRT